MEVEKKKKLNYRTQVFPRGLLEETKLRREDKERLYRTINRRVLD